MRQRALSLALPALLAGCHAADEAAARQAPADYTPPTADAAPAPVRVIDGSVIRDLAAGKTEGVYLLDLRRVPAAMRPQAFAERAEALACARATGKDAALACARRRQIAAELTRHGLCWGPDAETPADRRWMHAGVGCRH